MNRLSASWSPSTGTPVRVPPAASLLLFVLLAGFAAGCSLFEDESLDATLSGRITDEAGASVAGAIVTATFPAALERGPLTTSTNDNGQYVFSFSIDESESVSLAVTAELNEVVIGSRDVSISSGTPNRANVDFVLAGDSGGPSDQPSRESGTISRLIVAQQSGTVIRVQESGGPESVAITFVAVDSIGRRLASDRSVDVRFTLGQNPGAGLEVNPTSIATNALGEATAVVTSGTRSGVVQVIAEAPAADGGTVRSDPVRITIHGGMPAQERFTLGPTTRNIPGLVRFNEETELEVIVGDTYGNPVVPGTAVYFTTTHGLVGGSTETDDSGLGAVTLRSANPLPSQNGIAIATAETAGADGERVSGQTPVVFSGITTVTVNPGSAGFGSYNLTVDDPLGNPLAGGTSVSVTVEGTGTLVSGYTNTTIDDTDVTASDLNGDGQLQSSEVGVIVGPGITQFPFSVSRDPESTETPEVTAIKISVTSPNGNLDVTLFPSSTNAVSMEKTFGPDAVRVAQDADVTHLSSGALQITLREAV